MLRVFRTIFITALICIGVMLVFAPPFDRRAAYVGYQIGNVTGSMLALLAVGSLFAGVAAGVARLRGGSGQNAATTSGAVGVVLMAAAYIVGTLSHP